MSVELLDEDRREYSWAGGGVGPLHPYSLLLSFSRYFLRLMRNFSAKSEMRSVAVAEQEEEDDSIEESKRVKPREADYAGSRHGDILLRRDLSWFIDSLLDFVRLWIVVEKWRLEEEIGEKMGMNREEEEEEDEEGFANRLLLHFRIKFKR
ncbi:hypothetical protein KSP39_PZI016602 [Platanthera zijinensis]|uniref:Uncharacterized protein n=1 Tax=Platanthera zijinensis TaxID=2320716 RepID=A0AAP0G130_9ASPA